MHLLIFIFYADNMGAYMGLSFDSKSPLHS